MSKNKLLVSFTLGLFIYLTSAPFFTLKAVDNTIFSDNFEGDLSNWSLTTTSPNTITLSSAKSQNGSKSLLLHYSNASQPAIRLTHSFPTPQTGEVSIWFWDDLNTSVHAGFGLKDSNSNLIVALGVHTRVNPSTYTYMTGPDGYINSRISRTRGWHNFKLISTPKGSYGEIDGKNLAWLPNDRQGNPPINSTHTNFNQIYIVSEELPSDSYFDNLVITALDPLPSTNMDRDKISIQSILPVPPDYTSGNTVQQYRNRANRALALAISGQNKDEVKSLIRKVAGDIDTWYALFTGPVVATDLGFSSWIIWNDLDANDRQQVKSAIVKTVDRWKNTLSSGYIGDTQAENNSWKAALFSLAYNMFPNDPSAGDWNAKAKLFAFHTFTTGETYGGATTQTIYSNYLLDNHNKHPFPEYALVSIGQLGTGAVFYKITGKPIPNEFKHNVINVWNAHKNYVDFQTYLFKDPYCSVTYGGKCEAGEDVTEENIAFKYVSYLTGDDSIYSNLTAFEYYIRKDLFPIPLISRVSPYIVLTGAAERTTYALVFNYTSLPSPYSPPTPGDLNGDGKVNLDDFNLIKANFSSHPYTIFDYNILVGNFGK